MPGMTNMNKNTTIDRKGLAEFVQVKKPANNADTKIKTGHISLFDISLFSCLCDILVYNCVGVGVHDLKIRRVG